MNKFLDCLELLQTSIENGIQIIIIKKDSNTNKYSISNNQSYISSDKLYRWDTNFSTGNLQLINLYEIELIIRIKSIICNNEVAHAITDDGQLYSWGDDSSKTGILGLGYTNKVKSPILNSNLISKRINLISMSEKHCCCTDSYNSIFTWGTGISGELYQGDNYRSDVPIQVEVSKKIIGNYISKIICGKSYTSFLNYVGDVFYFGKIRNNDNNDFPFMSDNIGIIKNKSKFLEIYGGKDMIILKDSNGGIHLYNEYDKLIKLNENGCSVRNIKFIDNNFYIESKNEIIEYVWDKNYNINKVKRNVYYQNIRLNMINTPYYNNFLSFNYEDDLKLINKTKIFNKNTKETNFSDISKSELRQTIKSNIYPANITEMKTSLNFSPLIKRENSKSKLKSMMDSMNLISTITSSANNKNDHNKSITINKNYYEKESLKSSKDLNTKIKELLLDVQGSKEFEKNIITKHGTFVKNANFYKREKNQILEPEMNYNNSSINKIEDDDSLIMYNNNEFFIDKTPRSKTMNIDELDTNNFEICLKSNVKDINEEVYLTKNEFTIGKVNEKLNSENEDFSDKKIAKEYNQNEIKSNKNLEIVSLNSYQYDFKHYPGFKNVQVQKCNAYEYNPISDKSNQINNIELKECKNSNISKIDCKIENNNQCNNEKEEIENNNQCNNEKEEIENILKKETINNQPTNNLPNKKDIGNKSNNSNNELEEELIYRRKNIPGHNILFRSSSKNLIKNNINDKSISRIKDNLDIQDMNLLKTDQKDNCKTLDIDKSTNNFELKDSKKTKSTSIKNDKLTMNTARSNNLTPVSINIKTIKNTKKEFHRAKSYNSIKSINSQTNNVSTLASIDKSRAITKVSDIKVDRQNISLVNNKNFSYYESKESINPISTMKRKVIMIH